MALILPHTCIQALLPEAVQWDEFNGLHPPQTPISPLTAQRVCQVRGCFTTPHDITCHRFNEKTRRRSPMARAEPSKRCYTASYLTTRCPPSPDRPMHVRGRVFVMLEESKGILERRVKESNSSFSRASGCNQACINCVINSFDASPHPLPISGRGTRDTPSPPPFQASSF